MSIHIVRAFVTETAGQFPHNTPSGLGYNLVVEATADAPDAGLFYQLLTGAIDVSPTPLPVPAAMNVGGPPLAINANAPGVNDWVTVGSRFEGRLTRAIPPGTLLPALTDHMYKYFIVMKAIIPPDADGTETSVFVLT
jgi:hypothetical protein